MDAREILIIVLTATVVLATMYIIKKYLFYISEKGKMVKTTLKIDGMRCGMCEAHICDVIRRGCYAKKITASHIKGEAVILSDAPADKEALKTAIENTGYKVLGITEETVEKRGLFGFLKK